MYIPTEELKYAIDKSHEIAEIHSLHYLGAKEVEKPVDDLRDICEKYLAKKITYREHVINYSSDLPVRGFYIALNDCYEIVLLSGQNKCWQRLVLCKELFQVILDKEEYRNPSIAGLIEEVTVAFPDHNSHPNKPVASELLAEVAAMEYLFPYKDRLAITKALQEGAIPDSEVIAFRYRIPRILVEKYISKPYMESLNPDSYN